MSLASPGSPADAWPDDAVEVGRIIGAWGVKGWFKVQAFAADPQALFSSRRWHLRPPTGVYRPGPLAPPLPALLKITAAREHGEFVVAQAQDVVDRPGAEALRGASIHVSRGSFPTPAADEFYWVDLLGLEVFDRQGARLGAVVGLIDSGPHSILRVAASPPGPTDADGGAETLIPFVAAYVDGVDLAARRITVDWGADY
jgi:16S rRNA processing protein RimM